MNKYIAEVIGTFCLVFTGTAAIVANEISKGTITHLGIALTFGLIVMAVVYAIGDVSGAHINPAVTISFWAAGQFSGKLVVPYIAAQLIGAIAASLMVLCIFGNHATLGATLPDGSWWQSFVLEIVLTFILMFVILCVATGAKEKGIMAGAAIGSTVALAAICGGPISGASMNPARSFGPAIVSLQIADLWIYLVAPVIGAALAVPAHRMMEVENAE